MIFISYRRDDARGEARSIYQHLESRFGRSRLFMDVDTIHKGADFVTELGASLSQTAAMLVVIGKSWLDVRDGNGQRRLEASGDFVRKEIATGLGMGIPVIPILVDGAHMPGGEALPGEIRALARRQACVVTHENFGHDMIGVERALAACGIERRKQAWIVYGATTLAALVLAGAGLSVWNAGETPPVAPPPDKVAAAPHSVPSPVSQPVLQPAVNAAPSYTYGPVAPPESAATRVVAFNYRTPPQEVAPGLRRFKRDADGTWSNTYPNGHVDRGARERARALIGGCPGSVIGKNDEPEFAVFIPDKGCPGMMAKWRRGVGAWNILGPMENVR